MRIAYILQGEDKAIGLSDKENHTLLEFLQDKGLDIHAEAWSDPHVQWEMYDLVLLKSPWDYVHKIDRFHEWLNTIDAVGTRLLNPYAIIHWNSDKHYLQNVVDSGLNITPSAFVEKSDPIDLLTYFDRWQTDNLVIKPCIGGTSRHTHSIVRGQHEKFILLLKKLTLVEAFIIQPFIPEVVKDGEWSFLFFNGRFSHSLIKKPKHGDFRVQQQFGGSIQLQTPSDKLLLQADEYVKKFANGCLYARVDGVVIQGEFHLMELELIEPVLYLTLFPEGYQNYYQALTRLIELPL